jgi:hypothetical protein
MVSRMTKAFLPLAFALALSACGMGNPLARSNPYEAQVDLSAMPPDMPEIAIATLDPEVQRQINRGLTVIQRRLSGVCPQQDIRLMQEALVLFGWVTTAEVPNGQMQAYVERRAPELRAARDRLAPACRARVDGLVNEIRGTEI